MAVKASLFVHKFNWIVCCVDYSISNRLLVLWLSRVVSGGEGEAGAGRTDQGPDWEEPSFGYRAVAGLLGMNKNTVQRIFQLKGWQVRKRAGGMRPRIQALPSVAAAPDQRWATDLCRVWGGRDGWLTLALEIDCYTRQLLGWHLSRSGKASTVVAALEQALITRYGTLGRVRTPFLLRSDNGLVFTSRDHTRLVRSYGLKQELITPRCPQQNGMVERLIRTLKEQCIHRHRFESQ
jgi:putative transposase